MYLPEINPQMALTWNGTLQRKNVKNLLFANLVLGTYFK